MSSFRKTMSQWSSMTRCGKYRWCSSTLSSGTCSGASSSTSLTPTASSRQWVRVFAKIGYWRQRFLWRLVVSFLFYFASKFGYRTQRVSDQSCHLSLILSRIAEESVDCRSSQSEADSMNFLQGLPEIFGKSLIRMLFLATSKIPFRQEADWRSQVIAPVSGHKEDFKTLCKEKLGLHTATRNPNSLALPICVLMGRSRLPDSRSRRVVMSVAGAGDLIPLDFAHPEPWESLRLAWSEKLFPPARLFEMRQPKVRSSVLRMLTASLRLNSAWKFEWEKLAFLQDSVVKNVSVLCTDIFLANKTDFHDALSYAKRKTWKAWKIDC